MNNQRISWSLAVAVATVLAPIAARAVDVTAGDWKLSFDGNVNADYIYSSCESPSTPVVAGGLACIAGADGKSSSAVSNGLLPAALVTSASTKQDGYDIGVTFGFYPGISTNDGGSPNHASTLADGNTNTGLGSAGLDVRQVFLTFGNDTMGTVEMGRNIGLFGADAILNDMTLIGVGAGNGNYGAPGNTSLGSIGLGYIYTDWLSQIDYTTPDMSGAKVTVGIFSPLNPLGGPVAPKDAPGFHAKIAYTLGDLYLSGTFLFQKQTAPDLTTEYNTHAFDIGGKYKIGDFAVMAWYYNAVGVGTTALFAGGVDALGSTRDSNGFIAQATYTIGPTKLGINYGQSNLNLASGEAVSNLVKSNDKVTVGVYQSITKNLTLLAEYSHIEAKGHDGSQNTASTFDVGGFVAF